MSPLICIINLIYLNIFCPSIASYLQYNLSVKGLKLDLQTLHIQMEAFKSLNYVVGNWE